MEIRAVHRYRMAAPPERVWAALTDVGAYPSWWPWLRRLDARALAAGDTWRCTIRPPLPYAVRCTVGLRSVEVPAAVRADVAGDVTGTAEVTLAADGDGTEVRIASALVARSRPARLASRLAPGLARRGHDWVFDTAAAQFGRAHGWAVRALPAEAGGPAGVAPAR